MSTQELSTEAAQPVQTAQVEYIVPRANLSQTADSYILEIEMPGVSKDGVDVTVEDHTLVVIGHRPAAADHGRAVYRERRPASYRRAFELDPSLDSGNIAAKMEQGILVLHLPKPEQAKPRKITIS